MLMINRLTRNGGSTYLTIPKAILLAKGWTSRKFAILNPDGIKTFSVMLFETMEEVVNHIKSNKLNEKFMISRRFPTATRFCITLHKGFLKRIEITDKPLVSIDYSHEHFLIIKVIEPYGNTTK